MKKFIITMLIVMLLPVKTYAANVNVAFTIDNKYFVPAMLAINSILENNTTNSSYQFYIIEEKLSKKNKKICERFVTGHNQKVQFIHYSNPELQADSKRYFNSSVTMARLEMPELLPESVEKVLYLDADILVVSDLKELYDMDLKDYYVGMASDRPNWFLYTDKCGFVYSKGYYNSGIILMNLKKWREDKILDKIKQFVQDNKDRFIYEPGVTSCKYAYPDQDLINRVLYGNVMKLGPAWNFTRKYSEETKIYHFIGSKKPWILGRVYNTNAENVTLYYKYWNRSSLRHYRMFYVFNSLKENYIYRATKVLSKFHL